MAYHFRAIATDLAGLDLVGPLFLKQIIRYFKLDLFDKMLSLANTSNCTFNVSQGSNRVFITHIR